MHGREESPDVTRLMEENLVGHFSALARATPGMVVTERDGCLVVDSGLPCDTFNVVYCRAGASDAGVRAAVGDFRAEGRPFAVWVGPASRAARVMADLGLRPSEAETGMTLNPVDFRPGEVPAGLTVERVADPVRLAHFAGVVAANWEPPDPAVARFYELTERALLANDCPVRLFVGYWDEEPVAAAEAFLPGGVGGIYSVSTRASHRRRGIGTAMTAWAAAAAFRAGSRLATLQGSPAGCRVYSRLGFRAACEFTVFQ